MESEKNLPRLSAAEIRVLGALMEKSKTTPDYYPMTINALTAACNQKTSRKPVVDYSEETVQSALNSLKAISLVSTAVGGTSRTTKYKHNFTTVYPLSDPEMAVLCLLFLRGPQTPGEINTNSGRVHEFHSLESVYDALQQLAKASPPFVKELPRRPGQKEARFIHLLQDNIQAEDDHQPVSDSGASETTESRLRALEEELARVKEELARITRELFG
jgi:uncharacterized protein